MKRIKLLPSIIMLVLCVGILAVGVYAASPITGTIAGTINITASQGVKIAIYEGTTATANKLIQNAFGSAEVELNAGGTTLNASSAIIPEEVAVKYYTVVLSTNQSICYVVDTETIEVFDGVTASGEKVSGAAVITKTHKPTEGSVDYKGRPCLANGKPYTIQIAVHCGKILTEAINVGYEINIALHRDDDFAAEELNGIDYLYFGEYPQSEADVSDLTLSPDGVFTAYDEDATISSDIDIDRPVYTDGTNRYVLYNDKYYLIEPLKWRILKQDADGTTKLMCDTIIEQVEFQKFYSDWIYAVINGVISDTIYTNNYEYSTLREFMNKIFLKSAFSTSEQVIIKVSIVDNGANTTDDLDNPNICNNTEDKIFALSYAEAEALDFPQGRQVLPSDYGKATGVEEYGGFGYWWLRSPYSDDQWLAYNVSDFGYVPHDLGGYNILNGCVPAMNIAL